MACSVINLVACCIMIGSLLLILISFDPVRAGGIMKVKMDNEAASPADRMVESSNSLTAVPNLGSWLVHATYISFPDMKDTDCATAFKESTLVQKNRTFGAFYDQDNTDPWMPCSISILTATRRSLMTQRYYASYVLGCVFCDNADGMNGTDGNCLTPGWNCGGKRGLWTNQNDFYKVMAMDNGSSDAQTYDPVVFGTQDATFTLLQFSGFCLVLGIVCHFLAFALGGFIWNYSKDCGCNFGPCAFFFNALVWGYLSTLFYIICLGAYGSIYWQGVEVASGDRWNEVKWSVGGILIICGVLLNIIGISLASYQWYVDSKADRRESIKDAAREKGLDV